MKKITVKLCCIAALSVAIISCKSNGKTSTTQTDTVAGTEETVQTPEPSKNAGQSSFNIEDIPVSDQNLGAFPFFSLPEGLATTNKPIKRKYDVLYFPIGGVMTPLEGQVWKSWITVADQANDDWSLPYFLKSYDDAVTSAGGVKIFDGKISNEAYEKYHEEATYLGEDGSMGYPGDKIRVYVIRRSDGANVYLQLMGNTASGALNILQEQAFKQTISMLKSDEISKQLSEHGKAVLHINFDTDKASLKPDGKEAVKEIIKVLEADPSLSIAINGYTDNSGSAAHNKTLSDARAQTVKNEIAKAGIKVERLTSKGFGQDNPIADNATEEGKTRNRRVELVKM